MYEAQIVWHTNVQFVQNRFGRPLAIYKQHCFYPHMQNKNTRRWCCTSRTQSKCKASLISTPDGTLTYIKAEHNHPPPNFIIHHGVYVKI
ncbi:FLYWCH zinc finger domain-containing protein [Phthorimaea operculella]|nr:FLYWCH zinc finger domain-containing protein [Phthorimaea operculella]